MTDLLHKRKIRFAIIGLGRIGKRHAAMITEHSDAELVAMCDLLPKKDLGLEAYHAAFFQSEKDMFSSVEDIDVVCIATPNGLHENSCHCCS